MVELYVEGGAKGSLRNDCRKGFVQFLEKAGLKGAMPAVVPCGSRTEAYGDYSEALSTLKDGETVMLLVDSEGPINPAHQRGQPQNWQPWQHLAQRVGDRWKKPTQATDADCHFMVQTMESWLLADRDAMAAYYGQGFQPNSLPSAQRPLENTPKKEVLDGLKAATRHCKKGEYAKGQHSFELLGRVNPQEVLDKSAWAKRFIAELQHRQGLTQ